MPYNEASYKDHSKTLRPHLKNLAESSFKSIHKSTGLMRYHLNTYNLAPPLKHCLKR